MQIINIGTPVMKCISHQVTTTKFLSDITLLDADLIFWDVNSSHNQFPGYSNQINTIKSDNTINNLKQLIQKRKQELDEFFNIGRTLIITTPTFYRYEYTIPNSENNVCLDYIDCLEIKKPQYERVKGQNIQPNQEDFVNNFYQLNKYRLFYDLKIVKPKGIPLMYIKDTKYVVSEYFRIKNGLIIILPRIQFRSRPESETQKFIISIVDFAKALKDFNIPKSHEIPEWVNKYMVSGEREEIIRLSKLNEKLEQIETSINKSNNYLSNYKFLKALFASDGTTLENAVEYILQEMGFKIEKPDNNRDDLIIRSNDKIAVIEIKGLTKSAAEKNAAQLQKWVSNYHVKNDYNPKGILIVNTFKNEKIEDRTKVDFPDQMMTYVNQMNHCLITGLQLLCVYLDFKSKKLKKNKIIELFFDTVGELKYIENPMEFIEVK